MEDQFDDIFDVPPDKTEEPTKIDQLSEEEKLEAIQAFDNEEDFIESDEPPVEETVAPPPLKGKKQLPKKKNSEPLPDQAKTSPSAEGKTEPLPGETVVPPKKKNGKDVIEKKFKIFFEPERIKKIVRKYRSQVNDEKMRSTEIDFSKLQEGEAFDWKYLREVADKSKNFDLEVECVKLFLAEQITVSAEASIKKDSKGVLKKSPVEVVIKI